jgi:hypothetical protein
MLIVRRVLIFAALWLLFECVISLLATCDQVAEQARHYSGTEQAQKHCSALTGPLVSVVWAVVVWSGHVLEGYGEAVIAAFTIVLAIATGFLYRATRDLVRGAEDTSERQLRAYLSVELSGFNISRHEGRFFCEPSYKISNTGQTPAYAVEQLIDLKIYPWPLPADFIVLSPTTSPLPSKTTINPRQTVAGTARKMLTLDADALEKKGERIYVVGVFKFVDAFRHARHVRFCGSFENTVELVRTGMIPGPKWSVPTTFSWGQQHNDAD